MNDPWFHALIVPDNCLWVYECYYFKIKPKNRSLFNHHSFFISQFRWKLWHIKDHCLVMRYREITPKHCISNKVGDDVDSNQWQLNTFSIITNSILKFWPVLYLSMKLPTLINNHQTIRLPLDCLRESPGGNQDTIMIFAVKCGMKNMCILGY